MHLLFALYILPVLPLVVHRINTKRLFESMKSILIVLYVLLIRVHISIIHIRTLYYKHHPYVNFITQVFNAWRMVVLTTHCDDDLPSLDEENKAILCLYFSQWKLKYIQKANRNWSSKLWQCLLRCTGVFICILKCIFL